MQLILVTALQGIKIMILNCSKIAVQFWIRLQQGISQSPSLQRLQSTLQSVQKGKLNKQKAFKQKYISQIFSLQQNKNPSSYPTRLLYHKYLSYQTIPFTSSFISLPNHNKSIISNKLANRIYQSITTNQQFCFIIQGSKQANVQTFVEGDQFSQGFLYAMMIKLNQKIKQPYLNTNKYSNLQYPNHITQQTNQYSNQIYNQYTNQQNNKYGNGRQIKQDNKNICMSMQFLAVSQNNVFDLLNLKNNVAIRSNTQQQQQNMFLKPLIFQSATNYQIQSNYQLYTTLKKVFFRRKQLVLWNILVIKINFTIQSYCQSTSKLKKQYRSSILVQWIQQAPNLYSPCSSQSISEKTFLSLNQCILQLCKLNQFNKLYRNKSSQLNPQNISLPKLQRSSNQIQIQRSSNQIQMVQNDLLKLKNLQSFRNSLITRILKPYLMFNTQVVFMACCSIHQAHQNNSYKSLIFGKHINKLYTLKQISRHNKSINSAAKTQPQKPQQYNDQTKQFITKNQPSKHSLIQMKLSKLLQESKQKQKQKYSSKYQQVSKSIFIGKQKQLRIKQQLNVLKIKSKAKSLKKSIFNQSKQGLNQLELLEQQCVRLNYQQKKCQKQLENINNQLRLKFFSTKNDSTSKYNQIQQLSVLKNHYQDEIQLAQMQINSFLQQKQSIKKIYQNEISSITREEKQMLRKMISNKIKSNQRGIMPSNKYQSPKKLESSNKYQYNKQTQNYKHNKLSKNYESNRQNLIKQMQPYFKQINENLQKAQLNRSYDRQTRSYENSKNQIKFKKSFRKYNTSNKKLKTQSIHSHLSNFHHLPDQLHKLKKSRQFIRKRQALKDKVSKGRVQYVDFLQRNNQKYQKYQPKGYQNYQPKEYQNYQPKEIPELQIKKQKITIN